MKIKQYAGVLVMTLAVTAQTAYAAVVMQIDITDLNNVLFIATDAKSEIDDSGSYSYEDGITLKNILPDGSAVEAPMTGDLAASASIDVVAYVDLGVGETEPRDLCIYVDGNTKDQVFSTDKRAFDGKGEANFSHITFEPEVVCTTGDIVAGFEDDVSERIGQWQIIKTTVNCPPTNLSAEAGDGEAVITFMAGADNGSPITNYQYSFDDVIYIPLSPATASSPITITGLDNGRDYSITLQAVNSVGASAASEPVSVTPIAVPAVPAAPTNLSAAAGNGEAVITFMAGADNGSTITNYQYSLDGVDYTALSPADYLSPITITELDNGTAYSIRLKAINGVGASAASEPVSVTPATTPPRPGITNIDYGDAEIYISVSVTNNGGSAITGYTATCTDGTTQYTGTSATTRITVGGLTNGVAYTCRVRATNDQGPSAESAASPPVTPEEAIAAGLPIWLLYEASK